MADELSEILNSLSPEDLDHLANDLEEEELDRLIGRARDDFGR